MTNSILDSTKKQLQLSSDYDVFDLDVITHINTAFVTLHQLGIGPIEGFMIEDAEPTWDAFIGPSPLLNSVKTFVFLSVKLLFDPPGTSFHINSMEERLKEITWRLNAYREEAGLVVAPVEVVEPVEEPDPPTNDPIWADVDGGGADML